MVKCSKRSDWNHTIPPPIENGFWEGGGEKVLMPSECFNFPTSHEVGLPNLFLGYSVFWFLQNNHQHRIKNPLFWKMSTQSRISSRDNGSQNQPQQSDCKKSCSTLLGSGPQAMSSICSVVISEFFANHVLKSSKYLLKMD